jgi:hypothetical protein
MCAQHRRVMGSVRRVFVFVAISSSLVYFFVFLIKNSQSGAYSLYSSTAANRGPVYLVGSLSRDRLEVRLGMDIVMIHLRTYLAFNITR